MQPFFNKTEEWINALSHGVGAFLGIIIGGIMLGKCIGTMPPLYPLSIFLYLFGMLSSYICSTCYHALPAYMHLKETFRRWDHAAIYWHIAGSYSPITLIALHGQGYWGWGIFIAQWVCALIGTWVSFRHLSRHSYVETFCFLVMGCMVLVAFNPLMAATSESVWGWIIAEGGLYVTGAIFYSIHKIRYMHSIFHFFVLGGSICHIVAIWNLLSDMV